MKNTLAPIASDENALLVANTSSVVVFLSTWRDGGCGIQSFALKYQTYQSSEEWRAVGDLIPGDAESITISDLAPETLYRLRLKAANEAGSTEQVYEFGTLTESGGRKDPWNFFLNFFLKNQWPFSDHFLFFLKNAWCQMSFCSKKNRSSSRFTKTSASLSPLWSWSCVCCRWASSGWPIRAFVVTDGNRFLPVIFWDRINFLPPLYSQYSSGRKFVRS